jgi:hypothetical protein
VDPSFLIENLKDVEKTPPLQALYKDFVIDADKNLQLKGRGYELQDFNKVMKLYNKWHFEQCPKYESSYFIERVQKAG